MSVTIYAVVWIAASGYLLATIVGPILGTERSALLHATSVSVVIAFALILVRAALKSRDQYYCLGLAFSALLTGMLLPILDWRCCYAFAHAFMAVGYMIVFAIQWNQLREATANHAAD